MARGNKGARIYFASRRPTFPPSRAQAFPDGQTPAMTETDEARVERRRAAARASCLQAGQPEMSSAGGRKSFVLASAERATLEARRSEANLDGRRKASNAGELWPASGAAAKPNSARANCKDAQRGPLARQRIEARARNWRSKVQLVGEKAARVHELLRALPLARP